MIVCARCMEPVSFEDVTEGYYAVCENHYEDLDEWETINVTID